MQFHFYRECLCPFGWLLALVPLLEAGCWPTTLLDARAATLIYFMASLKTDAN
jgi:hypothetical protein